MAEFVAHLYFGLAQLFAELFPERFKEAARTGPTWRRIVVALFVAVGGIFVGLIVAALVLAAMFFIFGIFRALLT